MTGTPPDAASSQRPQKLAIVHFLGWMLGISVVLAALRALTNEGDMPADWVLPIRLSELGLGLAYGTAISGLGLFVWRWWTGAGPAPSQPGHWLLVLGGVALVIDLGTALSMRAALAVIGGGVKTTDFLPFLMHQIIGWELGLLVTVFVLGRLRGASAEWMAVTVVVVIALAANTATHVVSLVGFLQGAPGTWIWRVPGMSRVLGTAAILIALSCAELRDRQLRLPRDWLHGGGLVAALGLGLVHIATNLRAFW
jgi:hypothetical protein